MNSLIELLNAWGARFFEGALPMLWQSSILIVVLFAIDFFLRRKIRPAVRYTLWFVVFVKLLVPPTLALPTGAAWWLRTRPVQVAAPRIRTMTVSYSEPVAAFVRPPAPYVSVAPPPARLSRDAWALLVSIFVSVLLASWSIFRWRQIIRYVRKTTPVTHDLQEMLAEASLRAGLRKNVRLRMTSEAMSPAVCGLFRPVVLLPQSLVERLTPKQLQAVLLHELIHLRRQDVWVNCAQTLLQIAYWWHPLLWFANARMRRVREEAVDDAVMFALNDEAEIYAPTLLEVAKLAFHRPLATLGLVGILESRNALRHRIERLLNFTTPRRVGVSAVSVMCIAAFTALAVPMGEPPARAIQSPSNSDSENLITNHAKAETGEVALQNTPEALRPVDPVVRDSNSPGGESVLNPPSGLKQVLIEAQFYQMRPTDFAKLNLDSSASHHDQDLSPWWDLSPGQLTGIRNRIKELGIESLSSPKIQTSHGVKASIFIGDGTNNIQLECVPYVSDDVIKLTALARTTGKYAPGGKAWPDLAGNTNCAIFSRVNIPNGSGIVLRAENAGTMPENELIVLLKAKIVEPATPTISRATRGLPEAATTNASRRTAGNDTVSTLVANGKLLYELGKLDEAETNLNEALSAQPNNQAAIYYLSLLKQSRPRAIHPPNGANPRFLPAPNAYAHTNTSYTSAARQNIYDALTHITFDKISFPGVPLSEVVRSLSQQTQRRDSDQKGINFLLNRAKPVVAANGLTNANGLPQAFDPATGQPIATAAATDDVDLNEVKISLEPGLRDVRLLDVLEAIVKSADHPIKYSLLDYGIEFSIKGPDQMQLHTRTFKVDPNTFFLGLQNVGVPNFGAGTTNATVSTNSGLRWVRGLNSNDEIQLAVIQFFNAVGVKLTAPKSVFFNARQGTLTVHATDDDLELIEQAINTLNTAPPEVTVKVRFVEVDQTDPRALGFDRYLGNFPMGTNLPSRKSSTPTPPPSKDQSLTSGPRNTSGSATTAVPALASITGILTDPQFKEVLKALEQRDKATLLSEGEVTTLSGRQANFQVVDFKTIVSSVNSVVTNKATTYHYNLTNMTFGTTLDVVPYICADGYTIQLTIIPTITEFLGYDNPKDYTKYDENLKHAQLPLPKIRVRQMTTSATVWDGQTLVLGNLNDESVVMGPNGAISRQPFTDTKKKRLLIFITPTIIDPSGNRVHNAPVSKDYYDSPVLQ